MVQLKAKGWRLEYRKRNPSLGFVQSAWNQQIRTRYFAGNGWFAHHYDEFPANEHGLRGARDNWPHFEWRLVYA